MKSISRRRFIQNSALLTGGIYSLPYLAIAEKKEKHKFNFTQVKGRISANGTGIPQVSISDGEYIYQSDQEGKFEFSTDQPFVFFSYPAGYQLNVLKNGSVDFFKKLDYEKKLNLVEFFLVPNPYPEEEHHFISLADPQLQTDEEANSFIRESCTDLIKTKNLLNDPNLFGVGLGDLVFDQFDLFEQYNKGIQSTGIPFFQVLGNHDIDLLARSNEFSQYPFTNHYGPSYYSFNRGQRHYIVLSDVYLLGDKQYVGYLNETQLKWLEQDLESVDEGSELIVFLHIPSYSKVVENNPGRDKNKESLINRDALYEILKNYKAHLISGHVHWNENILKENIFEHNTAAISGAWWVADICYDGTPRGYGVYKSINELSWYYQSIGKEKSFQFRIYLPGQHPDFLEEYCINVWNWDPSWKIRWKEDGLYQGEARRETSYDPFAIQTFNQRSSDSKHSWINAQRTDHLFFFKPNSLNSKLEIEVIDRFGNIYTEKLE
ncbi:calcineurin-like phosphoesterase C-terminal domain-containing protein [Shivajiella indica]|uniref:Calcineurin-like phosphoesterase C-terminal domain-containing protein n=1 Tax=Shivajiella indica TaxID=872115 RepID=A0ABW5B4B0_9BACT